MGGSKEYLFPMNWNWSFSPPILKLEVTKECLVSLINQGLQKHSKSLLAGQQWSPCLLILKGLSQKIQEMTFEEQEHLWDNPPQAAI